MMRNIVLFGDSMLGQFGTSLIEKVESQVPDVQVHNCATGGATTKNGLKQVDYISTLKPDIVVLSFGTNDIFKDKLSPKDYLKNLIKIINSFNKSRIIIWITPPANDINDVDGTIKFNKQISEYNQVVREYCKNNVDFIDSFDDNKISIGKKDIYHEDDGIHLTDAGYVPFLDSLIRLLS